MRVSAPDLPAEIMFDFSKGAKMPAWFWLNVPADVLFFLAVSGIPLWMVLKEPAEQIPDHRPDPGPSAPASRPELIGSPAR
jgi:hypothetical protein